MIFDLDGVIVDSEPLHERAFNEVMEQLGYGHDHGIRFADYVGRSDFDLWEDLVARLRPVQSLAELLALKRNRMIEMLRQRKPVFAGVRELVRKLAPGYALAVASGSERAVVETVLDIAEIRPFFPVVVTAGDAPHGKPAPDIFLLAARQLGVAPASCWVIEDSRPGVQAGRAAGMRVIAITNTHGAEELREADAVVRTYAEIERLLLTNSGSE